MAERTLCVSRDDVLDILDTELNALYSEEMTTPEYQNRNFGAISTVNRIANAVKDLKTYRSELKLDPMTPEQKSKMRIKMYKNQRDIHEQKIAESLARIELINKQIEMLEKMEEKHEDKD